MAPARQAWLTDRQTTTMRRTRKKVKGAPTYRATACKDAVIFMVAEEVVVKDSTLWRAPTICTTKKETTTIKTMTTTTLLI